MNWDEISERRGKIEQKLLERIREIPIREWKQTASYDRGAKDQATYETSMNINGHDYNVLLTYHSYETGWEPDGGFYWGYQIDEILKIFDGKKEIAEYDKPTARKLFNEVSEGYLKLEKRREEKRVIEEERKSKRDAEEELEKLEKDFGG